MKQGTNFTLQVRLGISLSLVKKIEFVFRQEDAEFKAVYPSSACHECLELPGQNVVDVRWKAEDTWAFNPNRKIHMDTRITLKGCDDNPQTRVIDLVMHKTEFRKGGSAT